MKECVLWEGGRDTDRWVRRMDYVERKTLQIRNRVLKSLTSKITCSQAGEERTSVLPPCSYS